MTEQPEHPPTAREVAKDKKDKQNVRSLIIVFVAMFILTAVNIIYTNIVAHKFCTLMSTLDSAYNSGPTQPSTDIGRKVATDIHDLRKSLGCRVMK